MGALFSRVKTWTSTEDVTASDLNAEFDNVLTYLTPAYIDDYSANVSQMQSTADPGEVGSESLATSTAGEIQRLRKLISEITGEDKWYESPVSSLLGLANSIGTGLTDNRIVSGKVRSAGTNEQPIFLNANGAAKTVAVKGSTTNFIYYVAGTEYTISTDVSLTGLTAAPSTQNTCLINDANASGGQAWTKWTGEDGTEIPVDTMGTEISSLVGKFAAFKIAGAATEYFIAYVKSTTSLTKAYRGYFFDSSDAPVTRTTYTNNDTITLMKLTWVFVKTDGTLTATYNNPVWSKDEPTSPSLGDYWFDTSTNRWKVYGVGSYAAANATLVGVCIQDATNTVAARSFEFFANYDVTNTAELAYESATQVKVKNQGSVVNVWGDTIKCEQNLRTWDMTLDLDSGVTEAASTDYFFYLTQIGDVVISNVKPFDRRTDLMGYYHPHSSWRCLGRAFNNASQNLEQVVSYYQGLTNGASRSIIATDVVRTTDDMVYLSGASYSIYLPPAASLTGKRLRFRHSGTSISQVYTLDGNLTETINGSTTLTMSRAGEVVEIISDGSNWFTLNQWESTGFNCKAWAKIDQTSNADLSGTYSQSGTTITCTVSSHGMSVGHILYLDFTSGTAVDAIATVTSVADANTFTVTSGSATTSGNVTLKRHTISASGNVAFAADAGTGISIVNFTTPMSSASYATVGMRRSYSPLNGTAVLESSSVTAPTAWATTVCSVIVSSAVNRTAEDEVINVAVFGT